MNSPTIAITLERKNYLPGDILIGEYRVDINSGGEKVNVNSLETSVLWATEGKGETDIGVHFFERKKSLPAHTIRQPQRLSTVLPSSPLSYQGRILKVGWYVRVRLFLEDGKTLTENHPFRLGDGCFFGPLSTESNSENEAVEGKSE